ncbi:hypothetical protein AFLA_010118 [Aspergillus flavus NRRL3357]|nr:hypothetical protein AFLA_010118 [Aspergillus flavus NRRL3357]
MWPDSSTSSQPHADRGRALVCTRPDQLERTRAWIRLGEAVTANLDSQTRGFCAVTPGLDGEWDWLVLTKSGGWMKA